MAGKVQEASILSQSGRARLKRGRQPHWRILIPGRLSLGWQCWKGEAAGRWVLRRTIRRHVYRSQTLGRADDAAEADGDQILSYEQAEARARAAVDTPARNKKIERLTVRQALELYIKRLRAEGRPTRDVEGRGAVHILPVLGDLVVSELTPETLRSWLATMAAAPAQFRPKDNKPNFRAAPSTEEQVRARRATANRVLTMLKACLNHAYDEGHVESRDPWGRKLKPFRNVETARVRYLTIDEATRLINAADSDTRPLVRAALETSARYSELGRLEVQDFNADAGTVAVRKSKSSRARHIILTEEGTDFFRAQCAGRAGSELIFRHADGSEWRKSEQGRPMQEACTNARIKPAISFHILRHTWASHAVMAGVPLMVVSRNLGHADTRMVEKHYGHLAPSFIADAIRAGAPRFGIPSDQKIVPVRPRRPTGKGK